MEQTVCFVKPGHVGSKSRSRLAAPEYGTWSDAAVTRMTWEGSMTTIEHTAAVPQIRERRAPRVARPTLCFFYSPTSGPCRRAEGFLAQVLQRRQNHLAFTLQRVNCDERADLVERLSIAKLPTLLVVEDRRVRARLDGSFGCKEIQELLAPWLGGPRSDHAAGAKVKAVPPTRDSGEPPALGGISLDAGPQEAYGRIAMGLPGDLDFDRWEAIGRKICSFADASTWWLADWACFGEERYGDRYREAEAITGFGCQTLRNYAWVARRFDVSRRRDRLSFAHHSEVAALAEDEQDAWLDRAEQHGWSRNELRAELRAARASDGGGTVERLRLDVAPDRADRWRLAAEAGGLELADWLVDVADEAARR
jgi:hypothetical protein